MRSRVPILCTALSALLAAGVAPAQTGAPAAGTRTTGKSEPRSPEGKRYLSQPLVTSIYTADPSAHVFNGKIYVYPSHDIDVTTADTIWATNMRCAITACCRWTGSAGR